MKLKLILPAAGLVMLLLRHWIGYYTSIYLFTYCIVLFFVLTFIDSVMEMLELKIVRRIILLLVTFLAIKYGAHWWNRGSGNDFLAAAGFITSAISFLILDLMKTAGESDDSS